MLATWRMVQATPVNGVFITFIPTLSRVCCSQGSLGYGAWPFLVGSLSWCGYIRPPDEMSTFSPTTAPMSDEERFKLRFGPYEPPRTAPGKLLHCERRGAMMVEAI